MNTPFGRAFRYEMQNYFRAVAVLWLTVGINLVSLCLLTSLTEGSILAFRLVVIVKNRRLMGAGPETIGKQK